MDPITIKDLAGLSSPLEKLIDSVSKGIGSIFEPKRIIKLAKAEAEASVIRAKSDVEVSSLKMEIEKSRAIKEFQIHERIKFLEERRQKNINNVVLNAAQLMPTTIENTQPVDEDWIVYFFNSCQDISNEDIQLIWSKLLANEVATPGTYSLQTLNILRNLRSKDAILFTKICSLVWNKKNIIRNAENMEFFNSIGLGYEEFLQLEFLGLITLSLGMSWRLKPKEEETITYFDKNYKFKNNSEINTYISYFLLTNSGIELMPLTNPEPNYEYVEHLCSVFKEFNEVEIFPE